MKSAFFQTARQSLCAVGIYLAVSIVFFGAPVLKGLSNSYIGSHHEDPPVFMWFLYWWPYALANGFNPFITPFLWAPRGFNLTWATSVPGLSVLASPLTFSIGPVATYNILAVLAPALSAWAAYLICRHLSKAFWPSLIGGYVFGFSTYELAQLTAHLNLFFVCLVPMVVYLVLLRVDGRLRNVPFVVLLALALVFQFSFSTEVFATMSVFGFMVSLLVLMILPREKTRRFVQTMGLIGCAYFLALFVLSPYLYYTLAFGYPGRPIADPRVHSSDLLNFIIPTPITLFGGDAFRSVSGRFMGNYGEQAAYLGLPLLAIVGLFARSHWRTRSARLLLLSLFAFSLFSLGPKLNIGGVSTISLPWRLFTRLPLINHALPGRLMLYAFLVVAILVAYWVNSDKTPRRLSFVLVPLTLLSLFPNLTGSHWKASLSAPPFFTTSLVREYLSPGENTLIIPYGVNAPSPFWQLQSGMHFRIVSGPGGYIPPEFAEWPIVSTFYYKSLSRDYSIQLKTFLAAHEVRTVIVVDSADELWKRVFSTLGVEPIAAGGVILYRVPEGVALEYSARTPHEYSQRLKVVQFSALLNAAYGYLQNESRLNDLNPRAAEDRGLLPPYWGGYRGTPDNLRTGRRFWTRNGLRLGPWGDESVGVGLLGSYQELRPIIERYQRVASTIYFPFPTEFSPVHQDARGELLVVVHRSKLGEAARLGDISK